MLSLTGGVLGLIIGAVLGLTGAGGGIFAVPALVFGLGMDIRQAAPVALLAVGAAATLGALQGLRQGVVRYKAAMMLAAAGAVTAPLGVQFAHWLSPRWLNLIFVAIMLVVAYRMFMSSRGSQTQDDLADEPARVYKISRTPAASSGTCEQRPRWGASASSPVWPRACWGWAADSSSSRLWRISASCACTASSRPRSW